MTFAPSSRGNSSTETNLSIPVQSGKDDPPLLIALPNRQACALAQRVVSQHGFNSTEQGLGVGAVEEQSSIFRAGFVAIQFAVSAKVQDLFQAVFERRNVAVSVNRFRQVDAVEFNEHFARRTARDI